MTGSCRSLVLSPETGVFHKENAVVFYNRLTMAKLYCTAEVGSILTDLHKPRSEIALLEQLQQLMKLSRAQDIVNKLLESKLLRCADPLAEDLSKASVWRRFEQAVPRNLRLLITHRCNLACNYCQVERNLAPKIANLSMSCQVIDDSLNIFERVSTPLGRTIIITGGEPLLNPNAVKYVVETARHRFGQVRIILFTNGWKADQDLASFMAYHNVQVLVSVDGPLNERAARHPQSAKYAYDLAIRGYAEFQAAGCETGLSAVAGQHNIEFLDTKVISFFLDLEPGSLGINFPHYLINQGNPILIPMSLYVEKLLGAYKKARRQGLFVEQISRVLTPFISGTPRMRECSAVGKGITVDSAGKVGTCKVLMVANQLGIPITQIKEPLLGYEPFSEWFTRSPFTLDECQECYAIGVCGGGCAGDSWIRYGDLWQVDPRTCIFTKGLLNFFLWDFLEQNPHWLTGQDPYHRPSIEEGTGTYPEYFTNTINLAVSVGHQVD